MCNAKYNAHTEPLFKENKLLTNWRYIQAELSKVLS